MLDLTEGLSARGIDCDMLCACEQAQEIRLNEHGRILCEVAHEVGGHDDFSVYGSYVTPHREGV